MPDRIQLSRAKGWRKPEGAIVVARPSKWGNPYLLTDVGGQYPSLDDHQLHSMVVNMFRDLVRVGRIELPNWRYFGGRRGPVTFTYPSLAEIRAELAGRDLACWCEPEFRCHADLLLEIANQDGAA